MRRLIIAAAMLAASVCARTADAKIPLEGRIVPFTINDSQEISGTRIASKQVQADSFEVQAVLTKPDLAHTFALHLPAEVEFENITINNRPLDVDPLPRADGPLYLVDPMYLREGTNVFAVKASTMPDDGWAGAKLFTLLDTYEEAHFNQVFDDRNDKDAPSLKEIPMHPAQSQYDVLSYDCTWKPDMATARLLAGTNVTIRGKALVNNFQQAVLDFDFNPGGNGGNPIGMTVTGVDSGPSTSNLGWTGNNLLLTVTLPAPLSINQEFTIRVHYEGYPNNSFPKQIFGSNPYNRGTHGSPARAVVYTASQPYGARRWWPCKDHPSDKADTTIHRIIVPTNLGYSLTAVSNGNLQGIVNNGDSTETHTWINSHPISTYLMSMAISNYTLVQSSYTSRDGLQTMPVGHYIYPENTGIEGSGHLGTLQVLNYFADTFGEYPFLNEKYMTATWNISFAIEHQTCTSMPAGVTGGVGNGFTRRNIHELAHQWYGNKVTCHSWDHVWLNEGFATYSVALFAEQTGINGTYSSFVTDWINGATTTVPVVNANADNFANSVVYVKGAMVLHMLRGVLGDTNFFQSIRNFADSGYTTAMSQGGGPVSFQAVCESSSGLAPGSLAPFFNQWLYGFNGGTHQNRPTYNGAGTLSIGTNNSVSFNLRQSQAGQPFTMPVKIRFKDAANSTWVQTVENSTANETFNIDVGTSLPLEFDIDPDRWILKSTGLTINTIGLPTGYVGFPYSASLRSSGSSGTTNWSKLGGAPTWVDVSSGGLLTGTPPTDGTFAIPVRVTDNSGSRDTVLNLTVSTASIPNVVINEIYYDNYGSPSDVGEYIELYNAEPTPVDVSGWSVILVNGQNGNAYSPSPIVIPNGTTLSPGAYYVIGNATTINAVYPGAVNLNVNLNNILQDGVRDPTPSVDAVVLKNNVDLRVDAVAYSASRIFAPAGTETANARAEGGTGMVVSFPLGTPHNASLGRLPNGVDTNSNLDDFACIPPSPGAANSGGVPLPFSDNFDGAPNPAWRRSFHPIRSTTAGSAGAPAVASPAGGPFMEVYDSTGGGDTAYLAGDWNQFNFTGYIWIPQDVTSNGWSTGLGIATRNESSWLSNFAGYEIANAFYLEYQNGPLNGTALLGGALPSIAGTMRLVAVDGHPTINTGPSAALVTVLGSSTAVQKQGWNKFRMIFDVPGNKLYASINDTTLIYDGPIPSGGYNTSGGIAVGYREQHSGNPSPANIEGTWVDGIEVNTDTSPYTAVKDWSLFK